MVFSSDIKLFWGAGIFALIGGIIRLLFALIRVFRLRTLRLEENSLVAEDSGTEQSFKFEEVRVTRVAPDWKLETPSGVFWIHGGRSGEAFVAALSKHAGIEVAVSK